MFSEAVWEPPFSWSDECVLAALFHVFNDCVPDHSCLADAMFSGNSFEIDAHRDRRSEAQVKALRWPIKALVFGELFGVHGSHCAVVQSNNSG